MPRNQLTTEELHAREDRLPVWAKQELRILRKERDYYRDDARSLRAGAFGPADTNTKAEPYGDEPLNLPSGVSVEFRLGPGYHEVVRVRVRDGVLDVNANGGLVVLPKATNHVDLKVASH